MTRDTVHHVVAADWRASVEEAIAQGYDYLDLLLAVDKVTHVEIVARLARSERMGAAGTRVVMQVTDARFESLSTILPAADWHEREIAEMFGLVIEGRRNTKSLLRREPAGAPPLLRSTVLGARQARMWPGAAQGDGRSGRRRSAPPGVVPDWIVESGEAR